MNCRWMVKLSLIRGFVWSGWFPAHIAVLGWNMNHQKHELFSYFSKSPGKPVAALGSFGKFQPVGVVMDHYWIWLMLFVQQAQFFKGFVCLLVCLVGCLFVCLIDWLIDWLIVCLIVCYTSSKMNTVTWTISITTKENHFPKPFHFWVPRVSFPGCIWLHCLFDSFFAKAIGGFDTGKLKKVMVEDGCPMH